MAARHCPATLPLGLLVESVLDLLLAFLNVGEPIVKTCVLHLLLKVTHGRRMMAQVLVMIGHGMVMETMSREGHVSSLIAIGDLLIGLLLIVVKIAILPLPTSARFLGTL